jgi:hypothetical protein
MRNRQQCGGKKDRADQGEHIASVMLCRKISSRRLKIARLIDQGVGKSDIRQ